MIVKVKDAETKRNKASAAHTGWKKRTKTSTTTPKKVCFIRVLSGHSNFQGLKFKTCEYDDKISNVDALAKIKT